MSRVSILAELRAIRLAMAHVLASLLLPPYSMRNYRALFYKAGGVDVKLGAQICGGVRITGQNVSIGKGTFIGADVLIEANTSATISIGANVAIGPRSIILTSSHEIGEKRKRAGFPTAHTVVIEDGAWLGAGVTVLPGVTIRKGAVVAAGTVVHKDIEESSLAAGQPLRKIRGLG